MAPIITEFRKNSKYSTSPLVWFMTLYSNSKTAFLYDLYFAFCACHLVSVSLIAFSYDVQHNHCLLAFLLFHNRHSRTISQGVAFEQEVGGSVH